MGWFPKNSVVVPTDFSDESIAAIDEGIAIAAAPDRVHVIHVLSELLVTEPGVMWDEVNDESRCSHALTALRERLSDTKYAGLDIEVVVGDPGHEIVDFADRKGADMIVLPSHGRKGLERLLIGSVAERVVRLAHCPVYVIRRPS